MRFSHVFTFLSGVVLAGILSVGPVQARGPATGAAGLRQADSSTGAAPPTVSRTTKAVNYRLAGGSTQIDFNGTDLMAGASGTAKAESKANRIEINAKFTGLEDATKFGLEYLTYVLWAISPQGRAVNLGEVRVKDGMASL